jgi:hypothetical protein
MDHIQIITQINKFHIHIIHNSIFQLNLNLLPTLCNYLTSNIRTLDLNNKEAIQNILSPIDLFHSKLKLRFQLVCFHNKKFDNEHFSNNMVFYKIVQIFNLSNFKNLHIIHLSITIYL